jgi:NAD(P)-dependent dehydrogenase (short-subunit alcohol dehydrogenase family)
MTVYPELLSLYSFLSFSSLGLIIMGGISTAFAFQASCTVLGGTGVLGSSICDEIMSREPPVKLYVSYRDQGKAKAMIDRRRMKKSQTASRPQFFDFDMAHVSETMNQAIPGFGSCDDADHQILINTIGVIHASASKEDLINQILINSLNPIILSQQLLRSRPIDKIMTMLHLSSGDGEIVFLNSQIADELLAIENLSAWFAYVTQFLEDMKSPSYDLHAMEYAFGETPGYSLSKALLNRGICLLQKEFDYDHRHRFLAVCPGNFLSPMTTSYDLVSSEEAKDEASTILSASDAARHVVDLAFDPLIKGGRFYRFGKVIPW